MQITNLLLMLAPLVYGLRPSIDSRLHQLTFSQTQGGGDVVFSSNQFTAQEWFKPTHQASDAAQKIDIKYYLVFATDEGIVYAYDPSQGPTSLQEILHGEFDILDLIIDHKNKILFATSKESDSGNGDVSAYYLNTTTSSESISISAQSKTVIYQGGVVRGMTVDSSKKILYLADSTQQKVYLIDYSPLTENNLLQTQVTQNDKQGEGYQNSAGSAGTDYPDEDIYMKGSIMMEDHGSLRDIGQMCSDFHSKLFWTRLSNGTQEGLIYQTNLDADTQQSVVLANNSDSSKGIAFFMDTLYYLGGPHSLYAMNIEDQNPVLLYDDIEEAQDLIFFDNLLFVADGKEGILQFVLDQQTEIKDLRILPLHGLVSKNVTSVTVFVTGAVLKWQLSVIALGLLSSLLFL